jgi:uroporphyrinogen-III synthase
LAAALQNLGAEMLLMPMVEFTRADDSAILDAVVGRLAEGGKLAETAPREGGVGAPGLKSELKLPQPKNLPSGTSYAPEEFEWILFTSQNAVRFFAKIAAEKLGRERAAQIFLRMKAGAVGPTTADAARQLGFGVEHVANVHTGEGLGQELASELKGKRVLVPRSDRANGRFSSALRAAGAEVTEFVAYRTAAPKIVDEAILRRVRSGEADVVIFASPSAFHNLVAWIPANELADLSKRIQFTAIGPTTARALREAGVQVAIESSDASSSALANAIVSYYEKHPAVARRT